MDPHNPVTGLHSTAENRPAAGREFIHIVQACRISTAQLEITTMAQHTHRQIKLPFLLWDDWTIGNAGLISPWGDIHTPGTIRLLEWKAGFYNREMERTLPLPPSGLLQLTREAQPDITPAETTTTPFLFAVK